MTFLTCQYQKVKISERYVEEKMVLEQLGRMTFDTSNSESLIDDMAQPFLDLAEQMGWLPDLAEIINELPESSARLLRQRLEQQQEEE